MKLAMLCCQVFALTCGLFGIHSSHVYNTYMDENENESEEYVLPPCSKAIECMLEATTIPKNNPVCVICSNSICPCVLPNNINQNNVVSKSTTLSPQGSTSDINDSKPTDSTNKAEPKAAVDFGLIIGVSLTSVVFLILVVVVLIVFLVRNFRKAKYLKQKNETLELKQKMSQSLQLSAIQSSLNDHSLPSTPMGPSTCLLTDLHSRMNAPAEAHTNVIPHPPLNNLNGDPLTSTLDSNAVMVNIPLDNEVYFDYDENHHRTEDNLASDTHSMDKLPTYNSIFSQLNQNL